MSTKGLAFDFLKGLKIKNLKRKKKIPGFLKWAIYSLLALLVILGLAGYFIYRNPVQELVKQAKAGKNDFVKAQSSLAKQDFSQTTLSLRSAYQNFANAQTNLKKLKIFKLVPFVGHQVGAGENLITAGLQLSSGLEKISELASSLVMTVKKDGTISLIDISAEEKNLLLKKFYESPPEIQGAKAEIDLAAGQIEKISDRGLLKPIKEALTPLKEKMPQLQKALDQLLQASEVVPQIVGYPEEKTYLFLLQNNTELRPTGGFIGTYGILKVKAGEISYFKTDNVYNLDDKAKGSLNVTPPGPLAKYISADHWFFRDSNWSPDFPTSAQKALWFYNEEGGPEKKFDGVIAVTPTFIESLLNLTGPIQVDGVTFNSENVIEILQYQVEKGFYRQGISESERKEIIGSLATKLLDKLLSLPQNRWPDFWSSFQNDVKEKQILVYLTDHELQSLVEDQNWAGQIRSWGGDYFAVVDANMASLKSDPGVFRTIDYSLEEKDKELIATLKINYDNKGTFNWKSTRYRTYTRVLVPEGSTLIESSGAMENDKLHGGRLGKVEVTSELGKTVFGVFISIEPQEQGSLTFKYKLPIKVADNEYSLLIQKQPGTGIYPLTISLNFDKKIKSFLPQDLLTSVDNNKISLKNNLKEDLEFKIGF